MTDFRSLTSLVAKVTLAQVKPPSLRQTLRRGAIHIPVGSSFGIALLFSPELQVLIALSALTGIALIIEALRLRLPSLNRRLVGWFEPLLRQEERLWLTGSTYLLLASVIAILAFPPQVAALAILFAALGDPAAAIVGTLQRRIRFWGKSIEGHMACLATCLLIGGLITATMGSPTLAVAMGGAVAATLLQVLPSPLNDNLTMPVGSGVVMTLTGLLL